MLQKYLIIHTHTTIMRELVKGLVGGVEGQGSQHCIIIAVAETQWEYVGKL